jgi:translocation and assembly module TamA
LALALLLALTAGAASVAHAESEDRPDAQGTTGAETPGTETAAYEIAFEGLADGEADIEEKLRAVSLSFDLREDPPRSLAGLRRRAEQDVERFARVLRSLGHYDGEVRYRIEEKEAAPTTLAFTLALGPVYVIETVRIDRADQGEPREADQELLDALDLAIGGPAEAAPIIAAEGLLARYHHRRGHPFVSVGPRKTVINRDKKTLRVTYSLTLGPFARFGRARIEGAEAVSSGFIARHAAWTEGAIYDSRLVSETQTKLARTGLFDSVTVSPIETSGAGEAARGSQAGDPIPVDIRIEVAERPHRSLGFGASYSTSVGPGVRAFWEHRNLFDEGERLRTAISASPIERGADATFRKPFFLEEGQSLLAEGEVKNVTSEAFDELRASSFIGVERALSDVWTATLGPTLDLIDQDAEDTEENRFVLVGLRANLRRDSTDDVLNPTRGSRLELSLAPYQDIAESGENFVSSAVTGSRYLQIDGDGDFVLAGRARIGSILGAERSAIPAGKRFYAGGGGSVRGYGYQRLGPLDSDLDPIGGRSVIELGIELRTRIAEDFGLVPFLEGGNVYDDTVPPFDQLDLRWGAGLGFRYYTDIGPVRLDVAMPIDKRENIDDAYQIYVSLGQAF